MAIPVLLITGPLGVGKTTVLEAIAERLRGTGVPFAAIDLDALTQAYPPAPEDDRHRSGLMFQNLASVWQISRAQARHDLSARTSSSRATSSTATRRRSPAPRSRSSAFEGRTRRCRLDWRVVSRRAI